MARFDWDNSDYEAPMDFEVIPEGTEVRMKCTEAEDKECKGGEMVSCTFVVVEGEYKGRKIWSNFLTTHTSEKAQNFGRRMIAGWARACGKPNARSTDELLEKTFYCKLGIEKGTGTYKDKNTIASFLMPEGSEAPKSEPKAEKPAPASAPAEETPAPKKEAPKATPSPTPAPAGGKRNPWDD